MGSENRKKMQRVCDISLANAMTFGFDKTREAIWNEVLREAELIVADDLPLSAKGIRKGKQAVRSLKDATTAAQAGLVSKKLFNHFFQTRLRVYIACAIEDSIPGKWTCVWSNTRVKEVCFALNSLLSSVLSSKSQLLQAMPTAAALAFLECVREFEGCLSAVWWDKKDNHKIFMSRALQYAFDVLDVTSLPKEYTSAIKRASTLLRLTFLHLSAVTDDFSAESSTETPEKIRQLMNTATTGSGPKTNSSLKAIYFTKTEIEEVLKCVGGLDPHFHQELNYVFTLQKLALESASFDAVGSYCYVSTEDNNEAGHKNGLSLYTFDGFLLDASIMPADLNAMPLKLFKKPYLSTIQDILFELG